MTPPPGWREHALLAITPETIVAWLQALEPDVREAILDAIAETWCHWCQREDCHGACTNDE